MKNKQQKTGLPAACPFRSEIQLQENRGLHGAVVVARDVVKAPRAVHCERLGERRERVEQHVPVADLTRVADHPLHQRPAEAEPPKCRADVEPLHLAARLVQPPEGDGAGGLPV